jgi:hypothetical protein
LFPKRASYLKPDQGSVEEQMKLFAAACMPALVLGAATLITPAMAQSDGASANSAAAASPAQPAQDANSAAVPSQSAQDNSSSTTPAQTAMNSQQSLETAANTSSSLSSGNTQIAMNTTGNASDLSSVPDNQHKYSRAKRSVDNRSEDQTTKQLNQQESSLNGASSGGAQ